MPITLECQQCHKAFNVSPSDADRKYCSFPCRDKAYRERAFKDGTRVTLNCVVCGTSFTAKKTQAERGHKCCSKECRYKQTGLSNSKALTGRIYKRETRICPTCNKEFMVAPSNPKRYCSRNCANQSSEKSKRSRIALLERWSNPEQKQQLIDGIKIRSQSDEWRNAPHFQKGEKHPRFKGNKNDRATERVRYPYKEWRWAVFKRDNFTCQDCGQHGGILTAHHIAEWANAPALRYEVSNGVTLCEPCHDKRHGWERKPKTYKCVDCGKAKTNGQNPRCQSCANKKKFPERLRKKIVQCAHCGNDFKKRRPSQRFCSHACTQASQRKRITLTCETCGTPFEVHPYLEQQRKYCSQECYQQTLRKAG